jgi:cell division protein ZapE
LGELARQLRRWHRREGLAALLRGSEPAPKGCYIFGPVGRGKTMLMDLFFATTTFRPKRRIHFHEFMAEVHDRIGAARRRLPGDPIPAVARELAARARLLCFDELHVTDIADAMILGRLFRGLFEEQVVVVATSNVHPGDLYKDGLNRALFLPFIALVAEHMDIRELQAAKDFRLDKLAGKPLYFTPADAQARTQMDRLWAELTGNHPGAPVDLEVKGRKLNVPAAAMGVARFAFAELCEQPLGAGDFLHLAHAFHTLMIDGVPVLSQAGRDVTRRFINLIDTLYDNRVCLVCSAAAEPTGLYLGSDMQFLFDRTASRLIEMRSQAYLTGRIERLRAAVSA